MALALLFHWSPSSLFGRSLGMKTTAGSSCSPCIGSMAGAGVADAISDGCSCSGWLRVGIRPAGRVAFAADMLSPAAPRCCWPALPEGAMMYAAAWDDASRGASGTVGCGGESAVAEGKGALEEDG